MGKIVIRMPTAWVLAISLIAVLMLVETAMGEISRTGLVAEWHFDGDAKDSSGNGIDGTIQGATFADGKFGKAIAFSRLGDNVYFGTDRGKFNFGTGDFSIEFWRNYKGTTVHPNFTYVMGKTAGGTNSAGFFAGISTWGAAGNDYTFGIDTTTSPSWNSGAAVAGGTYSGGTYLTDTWHHIIFVRYGNTWTIYANGEYANSVTNNDVGLDVNNAVSFNIGKSIEPNWNDFKGLIDEVRIYNRALSVNEVKDNYEAGQIIITSFPSGAEVLVDGNSKGIASPTLSVYGVSPGTYAVTCKLSGHSDYDTTVVLSASRVTSVSCSPQAGGSISVSSTPAGASIYLDGSNTGKITPSTLTNVPTGTHTVTISLSGYTSSPPSQTVTVTSGGTENAPFTLTPIQQFGSISVSSTPAGASIYLDGSNTGKITPSTLTSVPTGTHTVTYKLSGYSDDKTDVTVASGSVATATCTLIPLEGKDGTELLQLIGVILILAGLLFTALTTVKKDIIVEVGFTERSLKYIGGAGIMLIIIGAYVLLKCFELL